ncbi:MAG: response regulator, partial [Acidobacteria bacterium]|nr:response regulator [Acidobacteriota bacterium]
MTDPKTSRVRALLVDDEPLARQRLRMLVASEDWLEVVGECGDGTTAAAAIQKLRPDLVFLDVEMPGASGFDVIEAIGADRMPFVVFVTAYD